MLKTTDEPYMKDPLFRETLELFQRGEWEPGLAQLDEINERYPSSFQLREFRKEMQLRADIDDYEKRDRLKEIGQIALKWVLRAAVLAGIIGLAVWGTRTYSSYIQGQWNTMRDNLLTEVETLDTAIKFRDAQSFLQGGQLFEAQQLLDEVEQANPNYPGLEDTRTEIGERLGLETQYAAAMSVLDKENYPQALQMLKEFNEENPNYKDVPLVIQDIENQLLLDELMAEAAVTFEAEDWVTAASLYESLRAIAPKYQTELTEERLVTCYINTALEALEENPESFQAFSTAESYFSKALVLRPLDEQVMAAQEQTFAAFKERLYRKYIEIARTTLVDKTDSLEALATADYYYELALELVPNDPVIMAERELAQAFIKAQEDFTKGRWDDVVKGLETLYEEDRDYANGTARQTLFDTYMERGDSKVEIGEYETALTDYQRAMEIAGDDPEAVIRLYWVKLNVAEIHGFLRNYEEAVILYQDAVTITNLVEFAHEIDPKRAVLLEEAERYAGLEWFRTSYNLFRRVLPAADILYSVVDYVIQEGDYLTLIANQFDTTVQAILEANDLQDPAGIGSGQKISIPTIREQDD